MEISNICNLQCSFCPEVVRTKGLIDLILFQKIIEQIAPLTDLVCFHLMGDPLVHPKLNELVEICHEQGVKIFFVTNGVLLREKQAELLLHSAFYQVNFSLHSFYDNFPNRDPTQYLDRIFKWTEKAFELRPELYINYRLWNLADVKLSDINSSEVKSNTIKNQDMLRRIEERFDVLIDRSINVKHQKSKRIKNRLYLHFDTEFVWPSMNLPVLGTQGRCYGLSNHFGILVDGTVVPCCLDKEGQIALGNMNERPILEILKDSKAQTILRGFQKGQLIHPLCQKCQYVTRFQKSRTSLRI